MAVDVDAVLGEQLVREQVNDSDKIRFIKCDVRTEMQLAFDACFEYFKCPIDVLINNAGVASSSAFSDSLAQSQIQRLMDIDLTSVIHACQMAPRYLSNSGIILNISSMAAVYPLSLDPCYTAAKAGVLAFSRACRLDKNISIVAICPFFFDTPMTQEMRKSDEYQKHAHKLQFITLDQVVQTCDYALVSQLKSGTCIAVTPNGPQLMHFPVKMTSLNNNNSKL